MNETNMTEALEPTRGIAEEIVSSIPDKIVSISEWLVKIEDALFSVLKATGIDINHFLFLILILFIGILSVGRKWKFIKISFIIFLIILIVSLIF